MKKEAEPIPNRTLVIASFLLLGRSAIGNHCTALISFLVLGMNLVSWGTPGII